MKTAISLPDDLYRSGDRLAKRLGVSRSELYARALAEYGAKHETDQITQRLNFDWSTHPETSWSPSGSRILPTTQWRT